MTKKMNQKCNMKNKLRIGVMGSSAGELIESPRYLKKAFDLGRQIAMQDCILINGACPGLPDEAARGAKQEGGLVFGISPAYSKKEHEIEYKSPVNHDLIFYTGMGFMERDIINIRSVDAVAFVGGGIGTLNEFTIAYDEERPIGILAESGGVSDKIPEILEMCHRDMKDWIIIEEDPKKLIKKLKALAKTYDYPTHEDSRVKDNKRRGAG